ncbi:MAG: MFS transporter [Candidatus Marinimicrobia bacterium]|jgi:fucose permease|nr:MFS transporter [Candidatus Neomarinimicrobiota bacterium]MDX9778387.1 MFS transporter [bacterium]
MNTNKLSFVASCLGMFLFGVVMLSLGTINTYLINRFSLDSLSAASLASLLPFGILIGSVFFGYIVDRYGYKMLLIVCTALVVASILLIAYTKSFGFIQAAFFVIGLTGGMINGANNALVADVSLENKSAKLSLLGVFYGIGAISLPLVTGLLSNYFSYQSIIVGIGIFLLLPLIYYIVIPFPAPKQQQGIDLKKVLSMFRDKVLILFAFVLFFQSALEGISNNWTTTYLRDYHNLAENKSLMALTLLVVGMTTGRLILSVVLRKMRPITVFYLSCILIALSILTVQLAVSLPLIWTAYVFLGMGLASGFPVMLGYIGERYPEISGIAFSFALVIALLGNTLLNLLTGFIARTWGIQHFSTLLIAAAFMMALLSSAAIRSKSKKVSNIKE